MNPSATASAIEKLAGHSVDVSLLPDRPLVVDVGCRDFGFSNAILRHRPEAIIIALDPDAEIEPPRDERIAFLPKALTHLPDESLRWERRGEASSIVTEGGELVPNIRLKDLDFALHFHGKERFDVVKLDCEGSEFGILENWPGPIARQISVEFHDFTDRARWNDAYFEKVFSGPLKDYRIVQHDLQPIGPFDTMGHWDSLLILR